MLRISKTIKKIALSLLVVGLAIGTQSYKNAGIKKVPNTLSWYQYNGSDFTRIGLEIPGNYTRVGDGSEAPTCNGAIKLCAVYINDGGPTLISIASTLVDDIEAVQTSGIATDDILLKN